MIIANAPVRISLGGGGTDLPSYYEQFGGAVLSTTIDKYFCAILQDGVVESTEIESFDYQLKQRLVSDEPLNALDALCIPKAVLRHFKLDDPVHLTLKSDIPTGSGLGLSGAVTTCLVKLISAYRGEAMDARPVADLATKIERTTLRRPIGLQDQFASAFGGMNFIEFDKDNVRVTPVTPPKGVLEQLGGNLMLFHSGIRRNSAEILHSQNESTSSGKKEVLSSLHAVKCTAYQMRDALMNGDVPAIGELLNLGWEYKKRFAGNVSNDHLDSLYAAAMEGGAVGGKITGAGGGGFFLLYCEKENQDKLRRAMAAKGLQELRFGLEKKGVHLSLQHSQLEATITPEGYLQGMNAIVRRLDNDQIQRMTDTLYDAYLADKQIFIMGNGGSAATASHFCSDLSRTTICPGKRGVRAIPLTDNIPLMTAWGNDEGYDTIFSGQLFNLLNPGDVVVGISGGGMSPNVLKAMGQARKRGAKTIGFGGFKGGRLKDVVDDCFIVPSENQQFIEDVHMMLVHLIASVLRNRISS